MTEADTRQEAWYHGTGSGAGPRLILVEDAAGRETGVVAHVVRHSPAGLSWGYAGSGPAGTARSLLLAALGDAAKCPACNGTGQVVYDHGDGEEPPARPYDLAVPPGEYEAAGLVVSPCWQRDCDEGYVRVPYQAFKSGFVAGWGREFRISRAEILAWLAPRMADRDPGSPVAVLLRQWQPPAPPEEARDSR